MKKSDLDAAMAAAKAEYKAGLQLLWENINRGQQKQLYKIPEIKALLDRFGVSATSNEG